MFVSFHGTNELHIENLAHKAMDEIRKEIFGMWPGGLELDELQNTQWRVRFKNTPWSLRDENVQWYVVASMLSPHFSNSLIRAWRMLVKLFTLFEERVRETSPPSLCCCSSLRYRDTRTTPPLMLEPRYAFLVCFKTSLVLSRFCRVLACTL